MRVWDVPVAHLCDKHLLAQHLEIHTMYSVITNNKRGYANHPETKRWRDNIPSLRWMHEITREQMRKRGFNHKSPIEGNNKAPNVVLLGVVDSVKVQIDELSAKGCHCDIDSMRAWYDGNSHLLVWE